MIAKKEPTLVATNLTLKRTRLNIKEARVKVLCVCIYLCTYVIGLALIGSIPITGHALAGRTRKFNFIRKILCILRA